MPFVYSSMTPLDYEEDAFSEEETLPDEVTEGQTFSAEKRKFKNQRNLKKIEENDWLD